MAKTVKMEVPKALKGVEATFFGRWTIGPGQKTIEIDKGYEKDFERMGFKKVGHSREK